MSNALHSQQTINEGLHSIVAFVYADATTRLAAAGFTAADLYKVAYQTDTAAFWVLINTVSPVWSQLNGTGTTTGADSAATYLTLNNTSSLSGERVFSVSGTSGLRGIDGGANGTFSLMINDNVVATLSGATFFGPALFSGGITGSIQQIPSGLSYLVGAGAVTVTSQSNGQIIISGSGGGTTPTAGAGIKINGSVVSIDPGVVATLSGSTFAQLTGSLQKTPSGTSYLVGVGSVSITSQSNGQIIISGSGGSGGATPTGGTGIIVDGSTVVSIDPAVVATLSGSTFAQLTGSLQKTGAGLSYLVAGNNVTVTSQSNGQIIIASTATSNASGADVSASYVTIGNTGSLPNERALTAGTGLVLADGGANGSVTLSLTPFNVFQLTQIPDVSASYIAIGTTGSLPNERALAVTSDLSLVDGGAGSQITIGLTTASLLLLTRQVADVSASYVTIGNTGSLPNERSLTAGTGLSLTDGGSGGSVTLGLTAFNAFQLTQIADVSASYVTIATTGSLPNERALAAGTGLTLSDGGSGGSVTLSLTPFNAFQLTQVPDVSSSYVTIGNTGSLPNERALAVTSDLSLVDGGAGGSITIGLTTASLLLLNRQVPDVSASYVTIGNTGSLPNERSLTAGTGLTLTDGGANSTVSIGLTPFNAFQLTQIADVSASYIVVGNTGSLPNERSLAVGIGLSLTDGGVGSSITIGLTAQAADVSASYVTIGNTGSLPNERALTAGTGLSLVDGGVGSSVTLGLTPFNAFQLTQVPDVSASYITVSTTGSLPNERALAVTSDLSLVDGGAGSQITIGLTTASLLLLTRQVPDVSASYVTIGNTGSLPNERSLTAGTGLTLSDGGANSSVTLGLTPFNAFQLTQIPDVSASYITISTTGSLPNERALAAGTGLSLTDTGAGGSVTLGLTAFNAFQLTQIPDVSASYITVGTTGSLPNERALAVGTGLTLSDGGAGGSMTVGINNNVIATISGSTFTGPVIATGGLSGSLQQTAAGLPWLLTQGSISITTMSNGQLIISGGGSSGGGPSTGGGDPGASYLTLANTASLSNERLFSLGTSMSASDGGANGAYTLGFNNTLTGTLTGANYDISNVKAVTFNSEFNIGNSGASFTINLNNGQKQKVDLTSTNTTGTFVQPVAGVANFLLRVIQDSTGGRRLLLTGVKWPGGTAPTWSSASGSVDIVSIYTNGTTLYGTVGLNFS